jgi:cysteine desulfurase/selenocysteine lyase
MIYLDNAATSRYKPLIATAVMAKAFMKSANPGRSGHRQAIAIALKIEETRERLRAMFGLNNIVFTKSCTEALNLAILSCVRKGEAIVSPLEHNSVYRPLTKLREEKNISYKIVQTDKYGIINPKSVADLISPSTQAIIINEVSNVLGVRQPIEEIGLIARKKGVTFIVDCAQSAGHTKTDYQNVDVICCSGHKGLHGPQGTGFLAFNDSVKIRPLLYGGTGTSSLELSQPEDVPEGLEAGTVNSAGIIALGEGVKWTQKNLDSIIRHIDGLTEKAASGLKQIKGVKLYNGKKIYAGVVLFNIGSLPSGVVADKLDKEYNIAVRSGLHCAPLAHAMLNTSDTGAVRASIGYNNTEKDILALLWAVKKISKG